VRLPPTHTADVREPRAKRNHMTHKVFVSSLGEGAKGSRGCAAFKKTRCDDSIASTAKHHTGEGEKDD
jgi:predicted Zn-dependent protease